MIDVAHPFIKIGSPQNPFSWVGLCPRVFNLQIAVLNTFANNIFLFIDTLALAKNPAYHSFQTQQCLLHVFHRPVVRS